MERATKRKAAVELASCADGHAYVDAGGGAFPSCDTAAERGLQPHFYCLARPKTDCPARVATYPFDHQEHGSHLFSILHFT